MGVLIKPRSSGLASYHGATKVRLRVEGKKGSENTDHPNEMGCFIGQDRPYLVKLDNKRVAMRSVITNQLYKGTLTTSQEYEGTKKPHHISSLSCLFSLR